VKTGDEDDGDLGIEYLEDGTPVVWQIDDEACVLFSGPPPTQSPEFRAFWQRLIAGGRHD
jgi:hypothetical protein